MSKYGHCMTKKALIGVFATLAVLLPAGQASADEPDRPCLTVGLTTVVEIYETVAPPKAPELPPTHEICVLN